MEKEMKPVRCGCGGEAHVLNPSYTHCKVVMCSRCGIRTPYMQSKAEAITAWNRAMGVTDTNDGSKERTAKVEGNRCTACDNHIRPCMKYCDHCGCRLEWE